MDYKKYIEKQRKRNKKILQLKKKNKTLSEIGEMFGITKQRVKEIIDREEKRLSTA